MIILVMTYILNHKNIMGAHLNHLSEMYQKSTYNTTLSITNPKPIVVGRPVKG